MSDGLDTSINPDGSKIFLTEKQKTVAREMVHQMGLTELTRLIFNNKKLDGRSKEGRFLRKFLVGENLSYETRDYKKKEPIVLTESQQIYIKENLKIKGKLILAKEIFKDNTIQNLSIEFRAVSDYYDHLTGEDKRKIYNPPKSMSRVVLRVNKYCNLELNESKLNSLDKERCQKLMNNIGGTRFVRMISELEDIEDRDLFESEFITHTYDKPDIPPEEVNLYINLCSVYVSEVSISREIRLLNESLNILTRDSKASKALSDTIHTKVTELNACKTRQEKLIDTLIGKRSDRIKNQAGRNKNILSLVHAFMKEDERLKAIKIAEREKQLIDKSIDDMEDASAFIARIVGPSRDEILN